MLVDAGVFFLAKLLLAKIATRVFGTELEMLGGHGMVVVCALLFVALYVIVLHALDGQTIGKLVVGARVVGADGEPPDIGVSLLRFLGYFLAALPFGLGFLMAGLRADRRALHDLLAGTRVERTTPRPA